MVRLIDVAEYANVSINTVSRVINNEPYVSEEKRQKVLKAIETLNYIPNESARRLKSYHLKKKLTPKKTFNIGCIVFSELKFTDSYYSRILEGIDKEIISNKYHLHFIYTFKQINENPTVLINMITPEKVDGVIFIHPVMDESTKKIIENIKGKIKQLIFVDILLNENTDCIDVDKFQAGYDAVKYLFDLGHRRIGFVGETCDIDNPRYKGFSVAMRDFGLEYDESIIEGKNVGYGIDAGYKAMKKIIQQVSSNLPTAIFAASDLTAIGAMRALNENKVKVPDDISIVGFDDVPEAQNITPALTTFRVEKEKMGILAVRKLLERINKPDTPFSKTVLPVELVVRQSTKRVKI